MENNQPDEIVINKKMSEFEQKIEQNGKMRIIDPDWLKQQMRNKYKNEILRELEIKKNNRVRKRSELKQRVAMAREDDDFLIDYSSDKELLIDDDFIENTVNEPRPKIIYSSRTHSQLSQFINEIKKTKYHHIRCVTMGSRKTTCINKAVSKLEDLAKINDRCVDLKSILY